MNTNTIERSFFFALLGVVIIFAIAIFFPFLSVIILGMAFSIVLRPIYLWIKKNITKGFDWIASLLTVIFFLIVLFVPLFTLSTAVIHQSQNIYHSVVDGGSATPFLESINDTINGIAPKYITTNTTSVISNMASFVSNNVAGLFASTLKTILMFILFILTLFYAIKDGATLKKGFLLLSPLKNDTNEKILSKLSTTVNGIIKGYFIIAIAQGILMGVGLAIFGVPNPVLWGVVAGVASLVPTIGTAFISVPVIIFLWFSGMQAQAVGMLIWAGALVGMVDNVLSPFIIGKKADIPPLLILFSVLGGVSLMGAIGILVGPLVISLLYTLISIYRAEANL